MFDLTLTQLKKAYDSALEQMAAESFLEKGMLPNLIIERLQIGNNPLSSAPSAPILDGNLRMTLEQARSFEVRYTVLDVYQNDATGFSAVALRDTANPGRVVLAVRSTELVNDRTRDVSADLQVFTSGFAFDQILSAQDFLEQVRPLLQTGEKIDLVGYSLSGNIVRTLEVMYPEIINQTVGSNVVFNATGIGEFTDPTGQNRPRSAVLQEMMNLYRQVEANPNSATNVPLLLQPLQLTAIAAVPLDRMDPNGNVYSSPRQDFAQAYIENRYATFYNDFGLTVAEPSFAQYYGVALSGFDAAVVANSGSHPVPISIPIEGQPIVEIPGLAPRFDYLNTHSLTLITDSLALQILYKELDPTLSLDAIIGIIHASSKSSASTLTQTAEGDTLEKALEPLRSMFLGSSLSPTTLPASNTPGSFGNLANRNTFYDGIAAVKAALAGGTITIEPFVELNTQGVPIIRLDPAQVKAAAFEDTDRGLAFRYALRALNPFAVIGADYNGLGHAVNGQLDLHDSGTGTGPFTAQYLADRAAFLEAKIELNLLNADSTSGNIHFVDYDAPDQIRYEIETGVFFQTDHQYLFGSASEDLLDGQSKSDHLYGGAGVDLLIGHGGNDYLQGDAGGDQLEGGAGSDRLLGGQGSDVLEGGTENDLLDGGLDNDILKGGAGLDTYIIRAIDGADTIEDSDGRGVVEFDGKVLIGGLRRTDDPANVFLSADETITLTKQGHDLVVTGSGPLTIKDYDSGRFGIRLFEVAAITYESPLQPRTQFVRTNSDGSTTLIFTALGDVYRSDGATNDVIHALAGEDVVIGHQGDDEIYGEDGQDRLSGGDGNDQLFGGADDDVLNGSSEFADAQGGDDVLDGGNGDDVLFGQGGADHLIGGAGNDRLEGDDTTLQTGQVWAGSYNDFLDGGEGNDILFGGLGEDVLLGGAGSDYLQGDHSDDEGFGFSLNDYLDGGDDADELRGGAGSDILIGGKANDTLIGDTAALVGGDPTIGGADSLDGGEGDDLLYGVYGDDLLTGGADNDQLYGQDGDDALYGGDGNDTLSGDLRISAQTGTYDTTEYRGAGGHDWLDGGAGSDTLFGGEGEDILIGGDGSDQLYGSYSPGLFLGGDLVALGLLAGDGSDWIEGGAGNDGLYGGAGDDELMGGDGADVLYGEYGNDHLDGGVGNDHLDGGAGDDMLEAGSGNNQLFGGDGDDRLLAGAGNDVLDGGSGVNMLSGGAGDDTYIVTTGNDQILETANGGLELVQSSVSYTLGDNLENLVMLGGSLGIGNAMNNTMTGTFGVELRGMEGDDVLTGWARLEGGTGNDVLNGRERSNTYVFAVGDGHDTIIEASTDPFISSDQADVLDMGAGVRPADVSWERSGDDLNLWIDGTTDHITIQSYYTMTFSTGSWRFFSGLTVPSGGITRQGSSNPYYYTPGEVEVVQFADGTVWGPGHFGGVVTGSADTDTYRFGLDSGQLTIVEFDHLDGAFDTVQLGAGITESNVVLEKSGLDLKLLIGDQDDVLTMYSYFSTVNGNYRFSPSLQVHTTPYKVDQVTFADGTAWDTVTLENQITNFIGTSFYDPILANDRDNVIRGLDGGDWLAGRGGNDTIHGGADDDEVYGDQGDDVLIGGSGNDLLVGGEGHDTYLFNLGDGIDTVDDTVVVGEGNHLQFGVGITPHDLIFTHDEAARTLTIQVGSSGTDQVILINFDSTGANGSVVVETLVFADGSTASLASLFGGPVNHAPTITNALVDQTVLEDAPLTVSLPVNTFADQDVGDVLTYSASQADGSALPAWLNFDATTRTFTGMPDDAHVGRLDLHITATDSGDLSAFDTFTLTVQNVNDAPILTSSLPDQSATEEVPFSFVVPPGIFADADVVHGDVLAYQVTRADGTALPSWLTFDAATQTLSGVPLNDDVGTLSLTIKATDQSGQAATETFALTIQNVNDAPVVANPLPDLSAAEDSPFTFTIPNGTFADVDVVHGDHLVYRAMLTDGSPLPGWLSFDPATRTFAGTPSPGAAGVLHVTVTATDLEGVSTADQLVLTVAEPLPQTLTGTAGNDILMGGRGDDTLRGLAGNDRLSGGEGNDLLDGGTGTDVMQGGIDDDTYLVDAPGDEVTELTDEGIDTVESSITYTLGANIEHLTLTGTAAINGTGNALDNVLTGNSGNNLLTGGVGNDTLNGGAGTDTLVGGAGNDIYVVEQTTDIVTELTNGGIDTVQSAVTLTIGANVEHLTLTGTASINGTGNSADNIIIGNSGNNRLDGGSGHDLIDGGIGHDTLVGGSGNDVLVGSLGDDNLNAGSGQDFLDGGEGSDRLDGGSGDDQLSGGAGNDQLIGGSGADHFTGGLGQDTLIGNSGNDIYNFSRGDGQDTIIDIDPFVGNQDRAVFGTTINPLDLVISRQVNDLRLAIHGSVDQVTVQDWYLGRAHRIETIQAGNGEVLLSAQVDQLIQAMAGFSQQTGLTWDQAIDQRPQDVQAVLAASWQ